MVEIGILNFLKFPILEITSKIDALTELVGSLIKGIILLIISESIFSTSIFFIFLMAAALISLLVWSNFSKNVSIGILSEASDKRFRSST